VDAVSYFMESDVENQRLDLKTDGDAVERQALWAGLAPGMRVVDLGCGSGRTTHHLHRLVGPGGQALGIDFVPERIRFAQEHFGSSGLRFELGDVRSPLDHLGRFDFVWMRFVLEYYRGQSTAIVENVSRIVRPGGILCLADLDYNCLSHYGLPARLERTLERLMVAVAERADFDPYVGRKLYAMLYDLGFTELSLQLEAHHLIYGPLSETDAFNWEAKVQAAGRLCPDVLDLYPGGFGEFHAEYRRAFQDHRRFTYTPILLCRGVRPG
jgi:SAM-dependent methyltransferase